MRTILFICLLLAWRCISSGQDYDRLFAQEDPNAIFEEHYNSVLKALREPVEFPKSEAVFRLVASPSFGKPLLVQLIVGNSESVLVVKRLSGSNVKSATTELSGTVSISKRNERFLVQLCKRLGTYQGLNRENLEYFQVADGITWFLEFKEGQSVTKIFITSPEDILKLAKQHTGKGKRLDLKAVEEFQRFCQTTLEWAGLAIFNYDPAEA